MNHQLTHGSNTNARIQDVEPLVWLGGESIGFSGCVHTHDDLFAAGNIQRSQALGSVGRLQRINATTHPNQPPGADLDFNGLRRQDSQQLLFGHHATICRK